MKFSAQQARRIAEQIRTRFGSRINAATLGSIVPAEFVAALISVEAGKDARGQISETATRFEPHVYRRLKAVRDGKQATYNQITQEQLKDATDDALRALAKSYGLCQVMGWWAIKLSVSLDEMRGTRYLKYVVKLLGITALEQLRDGDYASVLRIWNTGKPRGVTHDPNYVYNATAVMEAYESVDGPTDELETPPEKPEIDAPDKPSVPSVETVGTEPPVIEVKTPTGSITTKIAAASAPIATILGATGLKLGGVEFSAMAIIALCALIAVGVIAGSVLWDRDRQRQLERQKASMENLANKSRNNVVAGDA